MNNSHLSVINERLEKAFQTNKKKKGIETAWQCRELEAIWCSWRRHSLTRERLERGPEAQNTEILYKMFINESG